MERLPKQPEIDKAGCFVADAALDSFYRDRDAERWDRGNPLHDGPGDVAVVIERFSPDQVPTEAWTRVRGVVRGAVERAEPRGPYSAATLLNVVAQFAIWADTRGQSIDPESLFDPELIDRFIVEGCRHLRKGSRLNYRTQLWKVGQAVRGETLFPDRPLSLGGKPDAKPPYTEQEIAALITWCAALPTLNLRRNCTAMLALGLGAGLTSVEMSKAVGTDVVQEEDGLLISVIGDSARCVTVVERWESRVRALGEEVGARPLLMPDRSSVRDWQMTNLVELAARSGRGGVPKLSPLRLRITWIVGRLAVGVPVLDVADSAGIAKDQICRYLSYVPRIDEAEARRLMRKSAP